MLTPDQKLKLAPRSDQAMKLNTPASQAVTLNLIDPPPPGPSADSQPPRHRSAGQIGAATRGGLSISKELSSPSDPGA